MSGLTILHGCRTVQLTRGMNTLIDEEDFPLVGVFRWNSLPSATAGRFYAVRNKRADHGKQRRVFMHRVIHGAKDSLRVDHRNGDGLDNRRDNLRDATPRQNIQNQRRAVGISRFKGVARAGTYWRARIRVDGKLIQLGCHRTEEAAAKAYDKAASEHFGEFACTNADLYGTYS